MWRKQSSEFERLLKTTTKIQDIFKIVQTMYSVLDLGSVSDWVKIWLKPIRITTQIMLG